MITRDDIILARRSVPRRALTVAVISENLVQGLVRPVYQDDGCSVSGHESEVPASASAGVLPVERRPVRARLPTESL